jgi:hypothetical protein
MLAVWVAASFALTEPACAQGAIDESALAAIERTRTTDAAYSVTLGIASTFRARNRSMSGRPSFMREISTESRLLGTG